MPVIDSVKKLPGAKVYWVALSGGLDSMVLLHALISAELSVPVKAVHVHHGLSPRADQWQSLCESTCRTWGVPLETVSVEVQRRGKGLEDAAREARYRVFEALLAPGERLLTAHHGDDQVETLLLRLMRGAGPRGLAAMARFRSLGEGALARPLLGLTRAELEGYAQAHQLQWVEDESNADRRFDRNFLRHEVVPQLRQRWPSVVSAWGESAALCAESEGLLGELAEEDLAQAVCPSVSGRPTVGQVLNIESLQRLSLPRRHNLLRYWVRVQGVAVPGRERLIEIDKQLIDGREDARARVSWIGEFPERSEPRDAESQGLQSQRSEARVELRRFRGGLYLLRSAWIAKSPEPDQSIALDRATDLPQTLPCGGSLALEEALSQANKICLRMDLPRLTLRWREGGERCRPVGRAGSQTLKKLLQEYHLEPWWRPKLPLIYSDTTLVAVGNLWICEGFAAPPGQPGYRVDWRPPGSFD